MFISEKDKYLPTEILSEYRDYLKSSDYSIPTVKNYLTDLRHLILWLKQNYQEFKFSQITETSLRSYRAYLKEKFRSKPSIAARRLSSLRKFLSWAAIKGFVTEDLVKAAAQILEPTEKAQIPPTSIPIVAPTTLPEPKPGKDISSYKPHQKVLHHIKHTRPGWYQRYHQKDWASTLHTVIMIFFAVAVGALFLYTEVIRPGLEQTRESISEELGDVLAAASPPSVLSFQGRLTNSSDVPITALTTIVFKIYSVETGGSALWTSKSWGVIPDQNGIFSVCLGNQTIADDCLINGVADTSLPATLFTDNPALYLGVTAGGDSEMTPRQRIASVSYALNSDALEGFHGSQSPGADQVPILNGSGNLMFAAAAIVGTGSGNLQFQTSSNYIDASGNMTLAGTLAVNGDSITADGATLTINAAGYVDVQDNLTADELRSQGNIYVNYDGPDGYYYLYFYDNGSATAEYLRWNNPSGLFNLSDSLTIIDGTGLIDNEENLFVDGISSGNPTWGEVAGIRVELQPQLTGTSGGSAVISALTAWTNDINLLGNSDVNIIAGIRVLGATDNVIQGGAVITNLYGIHIDGPILNDADLTVTNLYGLYIEDWDSYGATFTNTPYAIYQAGEDDEVYFAGNVTIGGTCTGCGGGSDTSGVESVQVFTSTGAGTWTKPAGITHVRVEVIGGGGGGGDPTANSDGGGGGGAGGYASELIDVTALSSEDVTVGAGGTAGTGGTGGTGGTSDFGTATLVQATGGAGGTSNNSGGAGGVGTLGDINLTGATGGYGAATDDIGGDGGETKFGGGGKGCNQIGSGGAGVANTGGGGGGGCDNNSTGGTGGSGIVIVWEYSGTLGSDYAEWYETKAGVEAGDLVSMGSGILSYNSSLGSEDISILEKSTAGSDLIGVVSSAPGITLGKDILDTAANPQPIALAGRVRVKVSTENGPIQVGDLLTVSSIPGVAMKATKAGYVIGRALTPYNSEDVGSVLTFINTHYANPTRLSGSGEIVDLEPPETVTGSALISLDSNNNLVATVSAGTKFVWENSLGEIVAWITDAGEAMFKKVTALVGDFGKLVFGELEVKADSQTAGEAKIKEGTSELLIESEIVTKDSLIYITSTTKTNGLNLFIKEKKPEEGFVVGIERNRGDLINEATPSASMTIKFNWLIINQQD